MRVKGSVKNNLVELTPKVAVDLIDLIEQVSAGSKTVGRVNYFEEFRSLASSLTCE